MKSTKVFDKRRTFNWSAILCTITLIFLSSSAIGQKDGDDIIIGKYRKFHSAVTNEERTLLIWLPKNYHESKLSYPVVYLLYGQNTTGYLMPAITACDMLAESGAIPEMIIVGVANAERYRDYSSISDGYIENTVRFFRDELFPFINNNYRTKDYRIVIGPQAGAVFSFYTLMKHPGLFNANIIENPFVWQNRELLYKMADSCFSKGKKLNGFLYIKEENSNNPSSVETVKQFSQMMDSRAPDGFRFNFKLEEPSGYFVPPVPAKEGLLKLFEGYAFPDDVKVQNVDEIKEFYSNISKNFGTDFQPPEIILTFKSDEFLASRRFKQASDLLEYQLTLYPGSLNALMRLANLNRTTGNYETALRYYDEFLKIMPSDVIAVRNRKNNLEKYLKESLVYSLEKEIKSVGIDKAIRNFKKTKSSKDNMLTFTENDLNNLGYTLINQGNQAEAIKVFNLGIELFPQSANLFDSLGEVYKSTGNKEKASMCYKRSLELNPLNDNAKQKLKELQEK